MRPRARPPVVLSTPSWRPTSVAFLCVYVACVGALRAPRTVLGSKARRRGIPENGCGIPRNPPESPRNPLPNRGGIPAESPGSEASQRPRQQCSGVLQEANATRDSRHNLAACMWCAPCARVCLRTGTPVSSLVATGRSILVTEFEAQAKSFLRTVTQH